HAGPDHERLAEPPEHRPPERGQYDIIGSARGETCWRGGRCRVITDVLPGGTSYGRPSACPQRDGCRAERRGATDRRRQARYLRRYPSIRTLHTVFSPSDVPRLAAVELRNIRGFEHLRLPLAGSTSSLRPNALPRDHAAVVIGRNGTNKSTLLRAIAIGVASLSDASAMLSTPLGSLIRAGTTEADIRLTYTYRNDHTVVANKKLARTARGADEIRSSDGPSAGRT